MLSRNSSPGNVEQAVLNSRITLRSNPRAIVPLLLPAMIVVILLLISILKETWIALLGVIPIALIGYRLIRYLIKQFRNRVILYEDRIELDFMGEDQAIMHWIDLDRAGLATTGKRRRSIFLYHASRDQLLEISDEFESFNTMVAIVRERTNFEELDLQGFRTVNEYLRAKSSGD